MSRFPWVHNFSGADWGGKFVGITKKTWANAYLKLDDNNSAIQCLKELGEGSIQSELINDELPINVKALEHLSAVFTAQQVQQPCSRSDGNYFGKKKI